MGGDPELWEQHVADHLTAIKLAVQLLDRRLEFSEQEHHLAETAVEATNTLIADLLARWQPSRGEE